jgi:phosphatidylglycerophosphatase A
MNQKSEGPQRKPRLALAIATGLGIGYLPKAPGTFGSLLGVGLGWLLWKLNYFDASFRTHYLRTEPATYPKIVDSISHSFALDIAIWIVPISIVGVWAAGQVGMYLRKKDPQIVVVDEISGQLLGYIGLAFGTMLEPSGKLLLAGFFLFRLFDIWKPFPIRRLESLPGGWGIMADDWLAGLYAAVLLALARHFGL